MKKKISLSILASTPISLIALTASCNNDAKKNINKENELKIINLTNTLKKANKQIENNKKIIQELTTQLNSQQNPNLIKEQQINELETQTNLLNKQIIELRGKKIQKSDVSAKKLLNFLSNFLTEEFPNELLKQFPQKYENEKSVLNQIKTSVLSTLKEYNNTPEDIENFVNWQQVIMNILERTSVVANYVNSGSDIVYFPIKANKQLAMLFEWRIKDIDRLISAIKLNDDTIYNSNSTVQDGKNQKQTLIDELQTYKNEYLSAQNEKLLMNQIASWYKLEQNTSTAIVGKFINVESATDSITNRHFLAKFKVNPDWTVSAFPIYQHIVNEEFINNTKQKLNEVKEYIIEWLNKEKQTPFVRSLRFNKLYHRLVSLLNTLISITSGNNVKYSNFEYEKDVDLFVLETKLLLSDLKTTEFQNEKAQIDKIVDDAVNSNGTLWTSFANKNNDKRNSDQDNYEKMYKDFYNYYRFKIIELRTIPHSNFQESFARYVQYLTLVNEINHAYKLMDLNMLLGVDINDNEFKTLTKYDSTDDIDLKIEQQQNKINLYKQALSTKWELIQNLLQEYTSSDKQNALSYINSINLKANDFKNLLFVNFDENGQWNSFYSDDAIIQMKTELNEYFDFVNQIKLTSETKELNALNDDIENIKIKSQQLKTKFFGNKTTLDNEQDLEFNSQTLFDQFFDNLENEGYDTFGETYNKQIQLFKDVANIFAETRKLNLNDQEFNAMVNEIKNELLIIKQNAERVKEYNSYYDWNIEGDIVNTIRDDIVDNLFWLEKKLTNLFNLNNDNNTDKDEVRVELEKIKSRLMTLINELGDTNKTNELTSSIKISIDTATQIIQTLKQRKKKIQNMAKLIPIQEVLVLIRYWNNTQKPKLLEIMPKKLTDHNTHSVLSSNGGQDRDIVNFFQQKMNNIDEVVSTKSITSIQADNFNYEDNTQQNKLFTEFKVLEQAYAVALLNFIQNNNDTEQENLKTAVSDSRTKYYQFLNSLKDNGVILDNKYIRMSADRYVIEQDADNRLTPFDLLKKYITSASVNEIVTKLYKDYIK